MALIPRFEADPDREYVLCDHCSGYIFKEDDAYYGDVYYELNDEKICEYCIDEYLKENKKVFK